MKSAWHIDSSWYRNTDGHVVFAGSPLRAFKLSDAGATIAQALEQGDPLLPGHEQLTNRLIQAGALHPSLADAVSPHEITIVIPAYTCSSADLSTLQTLIAQFTNHLVIVVDDASPIQVVAEGITVVRHSTNQGPGAARNTALQIVSSPYVAFVDIDASITSKNLCVLASHFQDEAVGIVAPRVVSGGSTLFVGRFIGRFIGRYEVTRSPLDMGPEPALVKPLTRVSFVPSTILLARTDAVRQCNGFDEGMRYGEDVDLVWRLSDAGVMCRYEPQITGNHMPRASLRKFIVQRFNYGTSAAALARDHGSRVAPFAANIFTIGLWVSAASWLPLFAGLFLVAQIVASSVILLRAGDDLAHACIIVASGIMHSARMFADAIMRAWLWPVIVLLFFFPQLVWTIILVFVVPALFEWSRSRTLNPLAFIALRTIDNSAYCLGVWSGVLQQKSLAALLPRITIWRRRAG